MNQILTIENLSKNYGSNAVLKNLSLTVNKGSVYGLLGPNGSGKTTTLGILLDVIPQNSGSFKWFNQAEESHLSRRKIGSLLETPNFYDYLSAERNLKISADIKIVPYTDIERVLRFVNLWDKKDEKFKTFSLGMKQRLAIAAALLGTPEVLVLDEPTNGLDPKGISEIRELIRTISDKGITIIIASHMLDEVEKVCTDVAIIKNGVLLFEGKVKELAGNDNLMLLKSDNLIELELALKENPKVLDVQKDADGFLVKLELEVTATEISKYLFEKGIVLTHISNKSKSLEMQFLEITNQQ